ncbi:FAD-binding oxidoreductase [Fulvimarina sp. 2208YS6-2-32]|uniref:FAD-binding oxidoreductase n=1 Tax=Fulvimarina uroteuthidis TaxID=3098149 RepID=A0ABU5HZ38_9HYPH|nr:FAD-binding oxidoreductase [Fulvimarina sp. 2208YS6-2-32]MDY8108392.1 FAD-binding oxidoreductase [Fulvimarina sp. 2208YS6-2-32]
MSDHGDRVRFSSWGGSVASGAHAVSPADFDRASRQPGVRCLPYGNGRSYGDSCLLSGGGMIEARRNARILSFDEETGLLEAEAGILLSEIIAFAGPRGWFPQVLPGTQFVTLGGAIANDIHGKNHHRRGTFGVHVDNLVLMRSDQGRLTCSRTEHADLFAATISGMGLTGLIEEATIRLMRVGSTEICETTTRFDRLEDYFERAEAADERHEYAVAWIDSLATGKRFGRGHLICGDHAASGRRDGVGRPPIASVPLTPPVSPLMGPALKAFNEVYYRKAKPGTHARTVPFDGFFFPLDRVGRWNRLYGPRGLCQHQGVIPDEHGPAGVRALIECAHTHGQGSFLTVLKRFGAIASPGITAFARPGYTLTLDFPNRGARTLALLEELDRITIEAGGAVNPYKHHRMSSATFATSFPRFQDLDALRDRAMVSDFWLRTVGNAAERPVSSNQAEAPSNDTFTLRDDARPAPVGTPAF